MHECIEHIKEIILGHEVPWLEIYLFITWLRDGISYDKKSGHPSKFSKKKENNSYVQYKFKRVSKKKFGRGIQINQNMIFCVKVCYGQKKSYGLRDYH